MGKWGPGACCGPAECETRAAARAAARGPLVGQGQRHSIASSVTRPPRFRPRDGQSGCRGSEGGGGPRCTGSDRQSSGRAGERSSEGREPSIAAGARARLADFRPTYTNQNLHRRRQRSQGERLDARVGKWGPGACCGPAECETRAAARAAARGPLVGQGQRHSIASSVTRPPRFRPRDGQSGCRGSEGGGGPRCTGSDRQSSGRAGERSSEGREPSIAAGARARLADFRYAISLSARSPTSSEPIRDGADEPP